MLKDKELQIVLDDIKQHMHIMSANSMETKARLENALADMRTNMQSIEKHITPMHNRLDNMHSDISRLSFNVQDAIKNKGSNG